MIWVLNTNSNLCRIYDYHKKPANLTLLKEINHPENKIKISEQISSGKPGHYQTSTAAHGTYSPHSSPKEVEIDNFSREIAHELDQGRKTNAYEALIIIAPPHMHGLLNKHLDKHVRELIKHNIEKEIISANERELLQILKENTQFPE